MKKVHTIVLYGDYVDDLKEFLNSNETGDRKSLIYHWLKSHGFNEEVEYFLSVSNNDTKFVIEE